MDKLKSIKIKYKDGTYSDEIPIGVSAENVDYNDTKTLKQVLDLDVTKGTVEERLNKQSNDISSMSIAVDNANENANVASGKADAVDTRLNNIIIESGTSEAEVVTARTNANTGVTYTTLAQRLDEENSEIKEDLIDVDERVTAIEDGGSGGLTDSQKLAILNCFQHVAWTDAQGQTYYDELEDVLFPPAELRRITAVYANTGDVYPDTSLDDLKPYITVTAHYSDGTTETVNAYTLSGTLEVGTSTVTVSYSGKNTTVNVVVVEKPKSDMTQWSDGVMYTDIEVIENSYYNANGVAKEYSGWSRTGQIPCDGASKIVFNPRNAGGNIDQTYCWFFGEDKTPLAQFDKRIEAYDVTEITVPNEAHFFGLSTVSANLTNQLEKGVTPYA